MNKYQSIIDKINSTNIHETDTIMREANFNPRDISSIKDSVVVLSKEVFRKLMNLLKKCKDNKREYGCFIFGKEIEDNVVLFDTLPETYFKSNVDSIDVTQDNVRELLEVIESNCYNSIAHIHTHPNLEGALTRNYSDQDLYVYGYLQKRFQNKNKSINYLGGLLTTLVGDEEISFVFYDDVLECFYRIENIYIYENDDKCLFKLGTDNTVHVLNSKKLRKVVLDVG